MYHVCQNLIVKEYDTKETIAQIKETIQLSIIGTITLVFFVHSFNTSKSIFHDKKNKIAINIVLQAIQVKRVIKDQITIDWIFICLGKYSSVFCIIFVNYIIYYTTLIIFFQKNNE